MPDSIWHFVYVASKDLCEQLHELTGWDKTHQKWNFGKRRKFVDYYTRGIRRGSRTGEIEDYCEVSESPNLLGDGVVETAHVPAYDLGYLLRKVPSSFPSGPGEFGMLSVEFLGVDGWAAGYTSGFSLPYAVADSAEDALATLAIRLVELGKIKLPERTAA